MLEEKLNSPLRDMMALERDLLNASKKDDAYRSEEMKVEMFRMSLVEKFCEYMDSYGDMFKRGSLLLSNYQEEVMKTKSASRKQIEDILNFTLETDAEVAAESEALKSSSGNSLTVCGASGMGAGGAEGTPNPANVYPIFGAPLDETIHRDGTPIPRIVLHIVAYLDQMALTQMGIFRISGHNGSVKALKEAIDSGHEVDLSLLNNAHVAATLFKLYLRKLPDTLTIRDKFDDWIHTLDKVEVVPSAEGTAAAVYPESAISALTTLVESIPPSHARTLDYLISFCTRVVAHSDQNMMGARNLASLIAPNILNRPDTVAASSPESMLEDVSKANRVVECLIANYEKIFGGLPQNDLKLNPIESLAALAAEYPLCADRSITHGVSMIVDLPPDDTAHESGSSPKSDDPRRVKKKTVSSISLLKDRKIKKKDKSGTPNSSNSDVRQTVVVGESDFKVFPSNSASLRPISPRGGVSPRGGISSPFDRPYGTISSSGFHSEHLRTFSDIPTSSGASSPPSSPRNFVSSSGSSSLTNQRESPLSSPRGGAKQSPPSSSSDEVGPRSASAAAVLPSSTFSFPISSMNNSSNGTDKNGKNGGDKSPPASSPRNSKHTSVKETPSKEDSTAAGGGGKKRKGSTRNRKSSAIKPVAPSATIMNVNELPTVIEAPPPSTTRARRHSIGNASEEGWDPTKENFGSIDATTAADLALQSGVPSLMVNSSSNVNALVDDQSGSMRRRAGSRRSSSVLSNPFNPSPSRPPAPPAAGNSRALLTPTKRTNSSQSTDTQDVPHLANSASLTSISEASSGEHSKHKKGLSTGNKDSLAPLAIKFSPSPSSENVGAPLSPGSKDSSTKKQKDRTAALSVVRFEQPDDFNRVMDDHFGKGPIASYVVLGYNNNNAIYMQSGGDGGVTDLVAQLQDDQIQYGLIRISYKEDGHTLTRDVFVQWNGPKVSAIQKGIKKAHCGEVKNVLCPTAIEVLVSSKANFTLDTLLARSAPTASRVID